jgi:molybdate-binding protein
VAVATAVAVAVALTEESVVVTVAVAVAVAVAVSSADAGVTWSNCAEHSNNAAARTRIAFLKFMIPPYCFFIF